MAQEGKMATTAPGSVYRQRRATLAAELQRPLVIFGGQAPARNYAANTYPFRAGSSYLYFGGTPVEHAAWLIEPGSNGDDGSTLLRPKIDPDDLVWFGSVPSDRDLTDTAGLSAGRIDEVDRLKTLLAGRVAGAIIPPYPDTMARAASLGLKPADENELRAVVRLRLVKDEHELAAMRRAADVTIEAQRAALTATRSGKREADVAAAFNAVLCRHQCRPSYTPIITVRGETLHMESHPNALTDGALLLSDAAAEEPGGYASDITRTWPVNGRWTDIQRHLYDTVLRALNECVRACVPGARFREIHDLSGRIICEGLVAAGLLKGDPADLAARRAQTLFYPHGLGHLIGLDVHDMEDFGDVAGYPAGRARPTHFGDKYLRQDHDLVAGLCTTVEPGIYLVPAVWERDDLVQPLADAVQRARIDALLKECFGGIRIEHTICVRASGGPEILTAALTTDSEEIAGLVGRE